MVIQTYSPEHYAIRAAAGHDYAAFYEREIEFRRNLFEPPFRQFAVLLYAHVNETRCQRETEAPLLLAPVTRTIFASEAHDRMRLEFVAGPGGRAEKLLYTDEDGEREEHRRL